MGCSSDDSECQENERPAHRVTLTKGFWIGQTEVTQAAYKNVTGESPSHFKSGRPRAGRIGLVGGCPSLLSGGRYALADRSGMGVCRARCEVAPRRTARDRLVRRKQRRLLSPSRPKETECVRTLRHVGKRLGVGRGLLRPVYGGSCIGPQRAGERALCMC